MSNDDTGSDEGAVPFLSRFWVSSAPFAQTQDNDSTAEIADRMGSQLKFASGKSMNFIHAIDGTETFRG